MLPHCSNTGLCGNQMPTLGSNVLALGAFHTAWRPCPYERCIDAKAHVLLESRRRSCSAPTWDALNFSILHESTAMTLPKVSVRTSKQRICVGIVTALASMRNHKHSQLASGATPKRVPAGFPSAAALRTGVNIHVMIWTFFALVLFSFPCG